jgi:hypothetical protein
MSRADEITLDKSLLDLRQSFALDGDVISLWEAIATVNRHNKRCARKGLPTHAMPDWIVEYLAESAEKVHRLWLGIAPTDDRSIEEIGFNQVGKLRKVPQSDGKGDVRFRDERISHIAQAFGFVGNGWSAFQRHDRAVNEAQLLEIYDDPALQEEPRLRKEVQDSLLRVVEKQESVSAASVRNRLSKARKRQQTP